MELEYIDVAEKKAKQLNTKGITKVEDLVRYIPRKYEDYTKETGLIPDGNNCLILDCIKVDYVSSRNPFFTATCIEEKGGKYIKVVWFNQNYLYRDIKTYAGRKVLLCGKVTYNREYDNFSCANPKVFTDNVKSGKRIYPVYSKIRGMSDDYLSEKTHRALNLCRLKDDIPADILSAYGQIELNEAYRKLHLPKDSADIKEGSNRLIFNDLLYFALEMEKGSREVSKGSQYNIKTLNLYNKAVNALPYKLTDDQAGVLKDMIVTIKDGRRLNALLQGDVSCGKSIVAFLLSIAMADSGYQAAIMAPTQVLARQHYDELTGLLQGTGLTCAYYEGAKMKAKDKKEMLSGIKDGSINIVVGTHSLLSKDVEYKNLSLCITDEEHKFGVLQKRALIEKAAAGVHSVTMSATPIPRTLSQVIYGSDTKVYTIKQMPPGRQKVKSCVTNNRNATFKFIYKEVTAGHQVYVVCPAIEQNEKRENLKSVNEVLAEYQKAFPALNIKALTGKNKKDEVAEILHDFKENKVNILIATTVIEVGVNNPNASVIVIENAENFGLAGLHQLRGRVGRGKTQGYCILFSDDIENERLKTIVSTTDGFKIAEKDLEMRGTGEFIGTKQSGDDKYISLVMSSDENRTMYLRLKEDAEKLLDSGKLQSFLESIAAE